MKKLSELKAALQGRIASKANPTGLSAADLSAYTTTQMNATYDSLIPIDTLGISQVGDQSYFPLAIDGAADGAIGIPSFRNYSIIRESNGDFVGLRTATNAIKRGIYYAIARADNNAAITGVTSTSRQYNPGLPAGWEPLTTFGASTDITFGVALNVSTGERKVYVVRINSTFDQTKHKASLVDGDFPADTGTQFSQCAMVGNTAYLFRFTGNASRFGADIYTIDITNIGNGATLTSTLVTGTTSYSVNGNTVFGNGLTIALPFITNSAPSTVQGIMFPRRVKLLVAQQGSEIRILVEVTWYIATNNGLTREGIILYCVTYNTATKTAVVNSGASPVAYLQEGSGHVRLTGASCKATVDADLWSGFTRTGSGNVTLNGIITQDGVIGLIWNDNNSIPYMASYKLANFSGSAFDELLKLNPTGAQPPMNGRAVFDREVGPVTASGHVGFLSKTRVAFTKNDVANPGYKKFGYADNVWDVTYRYKSDLIDAYGFPPTNQSADLGLVNNKTKFMAIFTGPDSVTYSGGVLDQSNLNRWHSVDPTTYVDISSGASLSVTQTELTRIANSYLQSVTDVNKQSSYDKKFTQLIIPPDPTVPAIAIVYGLNQANLMLNWIIYEINPPSREGVITAGSAIKVTDGSVNNVRDLTIENMTLQHVSYLKASDGWIITIQPSCMINWVGNSGWFQFVLGRNLTASYPYVARAESYGYYAESGPNWSINPAWGVGYVDLSVSALMGAGGHIFNVFGNTVAALRAGTITARYMVLTAIAAAGYNLYVNEPITVLLDGVNYTLPVSRLNLQDVQANPSNSTWYLSIVKNGNAVQLSASKTLIGNDPKTRINIGTCVTGATQIQILALEKITMLGNNIIA